MELRPSRTLNRKVTVRKNGSLRIQTINKDKSETQQQYVETTDINTIMKKYSNNMNLIPDLQQRGVYADVSELPSYQDALNTVIAAEKAFESVPADLRYRLQNDPQKFIEYLNDPKNKEEATTLGFFTKPPINTNPEPTNTPNPTSKTNPEPTT